VGGAADLQGGPFFFKCEKAGEKTRAGGQDFSRGGPDPMPPPRRYGADSKSRVLSEMSSVTDIYSYGIVCASWFRLFVK